MLISQNLAAIEALAVNRRRPPVPKVTQFIIVEYFVVTQIYFRSNLSFYSRMFFSCHNIEPFVLNRYLSCYHSVIGPSLLHRAQ